MGRAIGAVHPDGIFPLVYPAARHSWYIAPTSESKVFPDILVHGVRKHRPTTKRVRPPESANRPEAGRDLSAFLDDGIGPLKIQNFGGRGS